ncbi:hypothetical protein FACS189498_3040 [Spirochaetia bacterium]|nr:hypothetical protein FACS189498_3040 [Spirochaetia bacterium]
MQEEQEIIKLKAELEALKKRLRQEELMSAITKSLVTAGDLSTLIRNALMMTGLFMEISKVSVAALNKETNELEFEYEWVNAKHGVPERRHRSYPFSLGEYIYDTFITRGEVLLACDNIEDDPSLTPLRPLGIKAAAYVPIYIYGSFWGILILDHYPGTRHWDTGDVQIMRLIADTISGLVIRNEEEKELIHLKEMAEQSSHAKGNFLSRMSHEMRTPMNAIIGMTTIAQAAGGDAEKMASCLAKINEASIHLLGVINDILDMSKIEAGKFEISPVEFEFGRMIDRVAGVINFRIEEKKQHFIIDVDKEIPPRIIGDEQRLAQIIANLLSNAAKFTPGEGTITLQIKQLNRRDKFCDLRFSVADTGIGITKEQMGKLFSLFEQADGTIARRFGGTGLGLSISKNIVELMGGKIWVESEPDKGSTFIFEVTLEEGAAVEEAREPELDLEKVRIMAVDNSADTLEYFKNFVESTGIQGTMAACGEEAWKILETSAAENKPPFDVVFLEWRLPDMHSLKLTKKIKEKFADKIAVILISATEWSVIENEAGEAGADGFVPKPLFFASLLDCIKAHVKAEDDNDNDFSGRHIILAEDVEINREIVISLLEDTKIEIDCAGNGVEAVKLFRAAPEKYDLVFMDIHMPEMDGYEAAGTIRAMDMERAKTIPIIAMTANVFKEDVEKCLAAGMNGHLGKPLDVEEVLRTLKVYLRN